MLPQLSLHYNSKGVNGMAGMGIKLEGLSIIQRVGATLIVLTDGAPSMV